MSPEVVHWNEAGSNEVSGYARRRDTWASRFTRPLKKESV